MVFSYIILILYVKWNTYDFMLYVNSFVAVFKVKQFSVVKNIHSEFFLIFAWERIIIIMRMIQRNANPEMSLSEVRAFRENLVRCALKDISPQERQAVNERKERMKRVNNKIISNSDGKNPILGY